MPRKAVKKDTVKKEAPINLSAAKIIRPDWQRGVMILATIFFLIWIIIGVFALALIGSAASQGAFSNLFGQKAQKTTQEVQEQVPTETELQGVGKVNVSCVQQNLSQEAIMKVVESQGTEGLTQEEKDKLDECIVEAASPTASPTPTS